VRICCQQVATDIKYLKSNNRYNYSYESELFHCFSTPSATFTESLPVGQVAVLFLMSLLFVESASDTTKATFLALFVPQIIPITGADRFSVLTQWLAIGFFASLLGTDQPFVVTIPAMPSLVGGRETLVTRGGADILDHAEFGHFLLVQFWRLGRENL
jgi:hypothetical protein